MFLNKFELFNVIKFSIGSLCINLPFCLNKQIFTPYALFVQKLLCFIQDKAILRNKNLNILINLYEKFNLT